MKNGSIARSQGAGYRPQPDFPAVRALRRCWDSRIGSLKRGKIDRAREICAAIMLHFLAQLGMRSGNASSGDKL